MLTALALAFTGCGSSDGLATTDVGAEAPSPDVGAEDLSFDLASGNWMAAAAGPDLILVSYPDEKAETLSAAVRTPVGSISSLPSLPFVGGVGISSVGDSVAVGGIECLNKGCNESVATFALLAKDQKSWRRLAGPEVRFTGEVEVSALGVGRHKYGLFLIGDDAYSVAPSGEVTTVPRSPSYGLGHGFSCVSGDTMIDIKAAGVAGSELAGMISEVELVGDVQMLRLGSIADGWQSSDTVPLGVRTTFSELCMPDRFSFQNGEQESSFSVTDGTWIQNPSNLLALVGNPIFRFGVESTASSVDGATHYLVAEGRVLAERQPGVWIDTTEKASRIWGTSDAVVAYDDSVKGFKNIGSK
ncbi:MAG: hypothetical protein WBA45_00890 [Microthrixaceae bacterium]